jgi:glycosyltransferase involved in cell wall biosynthesis
VNTKKILVVGDFISGSGLTRFIFNMFSNFNQNEYKIECVGYGIDQSKETDKKCEQLSWPLHRVIPITQNVVQHIKWWKNFFKKNNFDFIYFNYSSSWNYEPLKLARRYTKAKLICHSHNSYYSHTFNNKLLMMILNKINKRGKKFFNEYADLKIATSKDAALWMFGTLKNVTIVNNGIELSKFEFDKVARDMLRKQLGVFKDTKLIGFAGVLQERKNPIFALEVFAKYLKTDSDSTMLIIGKGPLEKEIKERANALGISHRVKYIAYTNKINKWYSAMDILLFPSLYEGFGLVPLEAQVSKLFVLASNNVAPQVFSTKYIKKVKGFDKDKWNKVLNSIDFKMSNERNGIDPALKKFDIKKQATIISNLLEGE